MKPSACSTSSNRTRWREFGDFTFDMPRSWPLRIRVRRSPMGSVIAIWNLLPARLGHAGHLSEVRKLAQRNARQLNLAIIPLGAARQFAAVMDARLRRIARQL